MAKYVIAIVVGVILLSIAETTAGEDAANWLALVVVLGAMIYHRDGLTRFADDLNARLV